MGKNSILLGFIILAFSFTLHADEQIKVWDYTGGKDVQLGAQNGCEAKKQLTDSIKTPAGEKCLEVELIKAPAEASYWSVQLKYDYKGGLKKSEEYEIRFMCKATQGGVLKSVCALNQSPWSQIPKTNRSTEIGTDWKEVTYTFTADKDYSEALALPRLMLARFGESAKIYFGPISLRRKGSGAGVRARNENNLFFNSGFEMGTDGYSTLKYLRIDSNKDLVFEKAVIDNTTSVSGKQSLRIPNRFREEVLVYPWEAKLQPKKEYHFSIWMKAGADKLSVNAWICNRNWRGGMSTFTVGREWKEYKLSFISQDDPQSRNNYYHLALRFGRAENVAATDLWLDNLQLTSNKTGYAGRDGYAPAADVEITARTQKIYISEDASAEAVIESRLINNTDKAVSAELVLKVFDDYTGRMVGEKKSAVTLAAGEVKSEKSTFAVNRYGVYRVEPALSDYSSFVALPNYFTVIGKYQSRPINYRKIFVLALMKLAGLLPTGG